MTRCLVLTLFLVPAALAQQPSAFQPGDLSVSASVGAFSYSSDGIPCAELDGCGFRTRAVIEQANLQPRYRGNDEGWAFAAHTRYVLSDEWAVEAEFLTTVDAKIGRGAGATSLSVGAVRPLGVFGAARPDVSAGTGVLVLRSGDTDRFAEAVMPELYVGVGTELDLPELWGRPTFARVDGRLRGAFRGFTDLNLRATDISVGVGMMLQGSRPRPLARERAESERRLRQGPTGFSVAAETAPPLLGARGGPGIGIRPGVAFPVGDGLTASVDAGLTVYPFSDSWDAEPYEATIANPRTSVSVYTSALGSDVYAYTGVGAFIPFDQEGGPSIHGGLGTEVTLGGRDVFLEVDPSIVFSGSLQGVVVQGRAGLRF